MNYLSACNCWSCCCCCDSNDGYSDLDRGCESVVRDQSRFDTDETSFLRAVTTGNEADAIAIVKDASKEFCEANLSISLYTALHYACIYGFANLMEAIVKKVGIGHPVLNQIARDGTTPYVLAMRNNYVDLANKVDRYAKGKQDYFVS